MLTALSYGEILDRLNGAFRYRYKDQSVRMVGILFARPGSKLANDEIIPNLDDFYHRSANHIDFFLAGYALGPEADFEHARVVGSRGDFWMFSAKAFDALRREIESMTTWQYSGATELLLANAKFDKPSEKSTIDFRCIIACRLDKMKADGAIDSVETFFESIFRFAESFKGSDPTWGFSDAKGVTVAGSALKRVLLSLIPKELGEDIKRAAHFAVRDVAKV